MEEKKTDSRNTLAGMEGVIYHEAVSRLPVYFRKCWDILEPGRELLWNWHHNLICEHLQACLNGQIKRLIINIPPRYMKSNLVTVAFPTWVWLTQPNKRFIFASYAQSLSTKHSVDRRMIIESEWYQKGYGHLFQMASDQNVKTEFQNDKRGAMLATSMMGGVTGKGGDFVIIDDPVNPKLADSDVTRENANLSFDRTFSTRLDDKENGVIIVVMQRLHENDLTGHLLAKKGWTHLKVPGLFEKDDSYWYPISNKVRYIKAGSVLHEERENVEKVLEWKQTLGSYGFAGQYLQEPSPASGSVIKREWFKYYKTLPGRFDSKLISIDATFKGEEDSDYVVATVWGKAGPNKYLLDLVRMKADFTQAIFMINQLANKWPNTQILIEDKANGPAIIATLKRKFSQIIAFDPQTDKLTRARAVSPEIEAGNVHLPIDAPWLHDFIEECIKFPKGKFDDQVDSMTQALLRFQSGMAGNFVESMVPESNSIVHDIIGGDSDSW